MMYALNDLLTKMGAPETRHKGAMHWYYFDRITREIAGFAEVRLEEGGKHLVAELKHLRHNYEDDSGRVYPTYTESFYLFAEKAGAQYKVMKIAFDGEAYSHPSKAIIELGLSIFHARALDISIMMVEQAFNKQDIVRPVIGEAANFKNVPIHVRDAFKREAWGIVVPFRPRQQARVAV